MAWHDMVIVVYITFGIRYDRIVTASTNDDDL